MTNAVKKTPFKILSPIKKSELQIVSNVCRVLKKGLIFFIAAIIYDFYKRLNVCGYYAILGVLHDF